MPIIYFFYPFHFQNLLHGDCKVQYTVNDNMISKSVSHFRDCKHRKFRIVDNFRGYRCDGDWSMEAWDYYGKEMEGRNDPEPLYSSANSMFVVAKKGDRYQIEIKHALDSLGICISCSSAF